MTVYVVYVSNPKSFLHVIKLAKASLPNLMILFSQNGAPSYQGQWRKIMATGGLAVAILLCVT